MLCETSSNQLSTASKFACFSGKHWRQQGFAGGGQWDVPFKGHKIYHFSMGFLVFCPAFSMESIFLALDGDTAAAAFHHSFPHDSWRTGNCLYVPSCTHFSYPLLVSNPVTEHRFGNGDFHRGHIVGLAADGLSGHGPHGTIPGLRVSYGLRPSSSSIFGSYFFSNRHVIRTIYHRLVLDVVLIGRQFTRLCGASVEGGFIQEATN